MTTLLAVDPGIRHCGCAVFKDGILVRCWLAENSLTRGNGFHEMVSMARAVQVGAPLPDRGGNEVAIEHMQAYGAGKGGGPTKDLFPLVGVGAAVAALLPEALAYTYLPREWKGALSKDRHQPRILAALKDCEKPIVDGMREVVGAKAHNVIDAVGIGLHHLGRLKPKRALAT